MNIEQQVLVTLTAILQFGGTCPSQINISDFHHGLLPRAM
jgi:hypothetical protein